jgi:ATP-dependent Clp protease ATP-binding subunit ClpA
VFERFTHSAREAVIDAQAEARRLEHRQIGTPHLLLALIESDAGDTLRSHGVTGEAVERELDALLSRDPRAGEDDAEVLAALGIDLARIREAVEASFGPGALDRALDDEAAGPRGLLARLTGGRLGSSGLPRDEVAALRRPARRPSTHLPFSPAAKKSLELALREAIRLGDRSIDADHLVLGLLRGGDGAAAVVLSALVVDVGAIRTAIETQRRRSA